MKKFLIAILILLLLCLASITYIFKDKIFVKYSEKEKDVIIENLEPKEDIKVETKKVESTYVWTWIWWSK